MAHLRGVDEHGVIHYVDRGWNASSRRRIYVQWCGNQRDWPELQAREGITLAKPRNSPVSCLFCLYLRSGVRRG